MSEAPIDVNAPIVRKMLDVLMSMPKPPERREVLRPDAVVKCLCGKVKRWDTMPMVNTGVVQAFDHVCHGCDRAKDTAHMYRLVCVGCRQIIARGDPYTTPSGFKILPGRFYHIEKCPTCFEGATSAQIAEEMVWLQKTNRSNYYAKTKT